MPSTRTQCQSKWASPNRGVPIPRRECRNRKRGRPLSGPSPDKIFVRNENAPPARGTLDFSTNLWIPENHGVPALEPRVSCFRFYGCPNSDGNRSTAVLAIQVEASPSEARPTSPPEEQYLRPAQQSSPPPQRRMIAQSYPWCHPKSASRVSPWHRRTCAMSRICMSEVVRPDV